MLIVLMLLSFLCSISVYGMEEKKVIVRDQSSMAVDQGHEVEKGKSPWDEPRAWTKLLNRQQKGLAVFTSTQESKGTQAGDSLPKICAICQEDLEGKDLQIILPCNKLHILHNSCLVDWVLRAPSPNCPICRETLEEVLPFFLARQIMEKHDEVEKAAHQIQKDQEGLMRRQKELERREEELEPVTKFQSLCEQLGLSQATLEGIEPLCEMEKRLSARGETLSRKEAELDTREAKLKELESLTQFKELCEREGLTPRAVAKLSQGDIERRLTKKEDVVEEVNEPEYEYDFSACGPQVRLGERTIVSERPSMRFIGSVLVEESREDEQRRLVDEARRELSNAELSSSTFFPNTFTISETHQRIQRAQRALDRLRRGGGDMRYSGYPFL